MPATRAPSAPPQCIERRGTTQALGLVRRTRLRCVVVVNVVSDARRATIRIDRNRWACAAEAIVSSLDGHDRRAVPVDETVTLDLDCYDVQMITLTREP